MKRETYMGFFSGLYERNETFLLISAVLFIGSIVIGYLFAGPLDPILGPLFQGLQRQANEGVLQLDTLNIFFNNFKIAFFIYIGGFTMGIFSAAQLFVQGAFIGYAASKFNIGSFLIFTLPHGIFEIIGIIISGTAGFRLASGVFHFLDGVTKMKNNISMRNQLNYLAKANKDEFKESLILFVIAVLLLLIAAFIEANFTAGWGQYIQSITG